MPFPSQGIFEPRDRTCASSGNASHLARPAEDVSLRASVRRDSSRCWRGKLGWPVTIPRKPWGQRAKFPQQSLTSRHLCLRINSLLILGSQERPSSLSLSSLICTMHLIIATSWEIVACPRKLHGRILPDSRHSFGSFLKSKQGRGLSVLQFWRDSYSFPSCCQTASFSTDDVARWRAQHHPDSGLMGEPQRTQCGTAP